MLTSLMENVGEMTQKKSETISGLLSDARKEVASLIASTEWEAYRITEYKAAVDRITEAFAKSYGDMLSDSLGVMWDAGADVVAMPLGAAGISIAAPEISMTALEIMQGYSADLVKNITDDLRKRINAEISMGVIGGKTPFQVMTAIGRNLTDPSVFKTIASRAEAIQRTEMARVFSNAREQRMKAIENTVPKIRLKKKWVHSGKANYRPWHKKLNGVEVDRDKNFPGGIPYPHAPVLSAKDVVNCGCTHVLSSPDWDKLSRDFNPVDVPPRAEEIQ